MALTYIVCRKRRHLKSDDNYNTVFSFYILSISAELTAYLYYTQADVWIGLSDIGQSGKFHWVDSSTLDYTNWLPGQPDGQILQPDGVSLTLYSL